ncbi:MAG TPA: ABC transporter permease subunit [Tepidisphaeraceae bacterium]|jgi:hypothetical protein
MPIYAALPAFVTEHAGWFVAGLIVVLGLLVYGLADVLRSRPGRIWAIGGVCFRDAIRRRVLWITPLAMLGIILVGQFQKPFDEQDAIRLTIKVCLFTTGLVVVIIALVTAATNLPREIDNRVIFTIVTKPVTRLEIVIGKVVGFARVAAVMLLVMGAFILVYVHVQSWWLGRQIQSALASPFTEQTRRVWLEHFNEYGLLQAQSIAPPEAMRQFARPPQDENGGWILGGSQHGIIRLMLPPEALKSKAVPDAPAGSVGAALLIKVAYEPVRSVATTDSPATPNAGPQVAVQLLESRTGGVVVSADQLGTGGAVTLTDPSGTQAVVVSMSPERAMQIAQLTSMSVDVQIICTSPDYLYRITSESVAMVVQDSETESHTITSPFPPTLRGSTGRMGQQLVGPTRGVQPVAVYSWRGEPVRGRNGFVPFELNVGVEAAAGEESNEVVGSLEVRALDRKTGELSPPAFVYPETRRAAFFDLPEKFIQSGDFDLHVRNRTTGHMIGLQPGSVSMVAGREFFALNLLKALFVLWLLAVLTAAVAFWCSTFVSWPIAVVLSTLIILGHWAVSNVDLGTGIGAQVANDFFANNAPVAAVVNSSVERLSRTLQLVANFLPDIRAFGITDRVERGMSLTLRDMVEPFKVIVMFVLPLLTLSYVFLRNKEVAP